MEYERRIKMNEGKKTKQAKGKFFIKATALVVLLCFSLTQPVMILARSKRSSRGMDAFGVAGGAFLATQTPISGQSFSTALRNYTVSYAVPK
ncbi:MAG: hypothetical protein ABIK26_06770, partial [Candidatus Omnitrophota bacterium]